MFSSIFLVHQWTGYEAVTDEDQCRTLVTIIVIADTEVAGNGVILWRHSYRLLIRM